MIVSEWAGAAVHLGRSRHSDRCLSRSVEEQGGHSLAVVEVTADSRCTGAVVVGADRSHIAVVGMAHSRA